MVRTSHVYRERPPDVPTEAEERGSGSEIGDFAKNGHLYAPVTAAKQSQSAMDYLKLPPTPLNYRRLPRPTARLPQSRQDRCQAPANYAGRISKPPQQFNDNLCKDKNLKAIHNRIKVTTPGQLRFSRTRSLGSACG